jgi:hypothetical protein
VFGVVALLAVMLPRQVRLQLSGVTVESNTNLVSGVGMRNAFEVCGSASSVTTERSGSQDTLCHLEAWMTEADNSRGRVDLSCCD